MSHRNYLYAFPERLTPDTWPTYDVADLPSPATVYGCKGETVRCGGWRSPGVDTPAGLAAISCEGAWVLHYWPVRCFAEQVHLLACRLMCRCGQPPCGWASLAASSCASCCTWASRARSSSASRECMGGFVGSCQAGYIWAEHDWACFAGLLPTSLLAPPSACAGMPGLMAVHLHPLPALQLCDHHFVDPGPRRLLPGLLLAHPR